VPKGRVLVIEADKTASDLLATVLGGRDYEVVICESAREGFAKACEWMPDCIICGVELPDIDGFYVARRIRTEHTSVAVTPFLFLTEAEDRESRLQGFHVGADAYLTKPLTEKEVVAQVEALMDMARRLRVRRDSFLEVGPSSHPGPVAFRGDIAQMSLPTVLTILEMERRSGVLKIASTMGRTAVLTLAGNGSFGECSLRGQSATPIQVLREAMTWKKGRFWFKPSETGPAPPGRGSIGQMLLEALRLDDESEVDAIDVDFNSPTSKKHPVLKSDGPSAPVEIEATPVEDPPVQTAKPPKPPPPKKPAPPKPEPEKEPSADDVDDSWDV
jgi:CheY-like chemotaxis protein